MAEAALTLLWLQALALCGGIAVACVLRVLVRRLFGAQAAFACWLVVPASALAAVLPWPRALPPLLLAGSGPWAELPRVIAAARTGASRPDIDAALLLSAWALGAAATAAWMAMQQWRWSRGVVRRPLQSHDDLPAGRSPAWVGLFNPRLALPLDFETRFDADERRAVLLHEAMHGHRRDNAWRLLAHTLTALHWFNPLAWWALARLRADQELACDAAVMNAPQAPPPALYARAMLKALHVELAAPAATSAWHSTHPVVERIAMLKLHPLSSARRRAGRWLAALASAGTLLVGHALHAAPPGAEKVQLQMTIEQDGKVLAKPRMIGALGSPMSLRWKAEGAAGETWQLETTVSKADAGLLQVNSKLSRGEPLRAVAEPRLLTAPGEPARIETGGRDGAGVLGISIVATLLAADAPLPGAVPK